MSAVETGTHQIVLILDDDLGITEGLAGGLARSERTIITANDLEAAEMVVEWLKPSHVVSDVRLTGDFGYEGLDFIRFIKRASPDTRIILMTGDAPDALQLEASQRGAVGFLRKPFDTGELDAVLNLMAPPRIGSPEWPDVIRMPLLDDIIASDKLTANFQPIVRLATGDYVGYEALARFQSDTPLRNPETLFKYAVRKHRTAELEIACMTRSLRAGRSLQLKAPLFLNVHPDVFAAGNSLYETVMTETEKSGVPPNRLVLEITEQATLSHDSKVREIIQRLKSAGVRFAFDDVGVAYSHLPFIDAVRPSFLKISQAFGTGFELDPTKTKIVKNLLSLSKDFDSDLILEGIETAATSAAAVELGIKYGQGYYFSMPADASKFA